MGIVLVTNLKFSTEFYNRVDKINMNNTKIVSAEKTGTKHFNMAD